MSFGADQCTLLPQGIVDMTVSTSLKRTGQIWDTRSKHQGGFYVPILAKVSGGRRPEQRVSAVRTACLDKENSDFVFCFGGFCCFLTVLLLRNLNACYYFIVL